MAITNWIDAIAEVFELPLTDKGLEMHSYRLFGVAEYPESLSVWPCALSYPTGVVMKYGSTSYDLWTGRTEIHVAPDMKAVHWPFLLEFYNLIKTAVAAHYTLNGLVDYFLLRVEGGQSVEGPVGLQFGVENPHWGFVVHWIVKEKTTVNISG